MDRITILINQKHQRSRRVLTNDPVPGPTPLGPDSRTSTCSLVPQGSPGAVGPVGPVGPSGVRVSTERLSSVRTQEVLVLKPGSPVSRDLQERRDQPDPEDHQDPW